MTVTAGSRCETDAQEPHWTAALHRVDRLTPREFEVFVMMAEGLPNEKMASRLHLTERTVRAHLSAVTEKLELDSRLSVCLASYAFRCDTFRVPHGTATNIVANDNGCRCGRRGE